jgi:hypothetical protein
MKIIIKIINIFRRFTKSVGKRERKLIRLIAFLNWCSRKDTNNLIFDEKKILRPIDDFKKDQLWPKKIAVFIIFFYKEERIKFLKKICENLEKIDNNIDITLIVNKVGFDKKEEIKNKISSNTSLKIDFFYPKNLLDPRLLTYSHFEVVKQKLLDKSITHYLYLEDDILIKPENIKYWVIANESLKKYGLIPVFLRTEKNKIDNELYLVDSIQKNNVFWQPKIATQKKNCGFINLLDYFTPAYFYTRELMLEHIEGPSGSIDFGHATYDERWNIPKMQEQGVMERASTLLAFKDIPKGFLHRNVVPIDFNKKILKNYCLIEHLSDRFTNVDSCFGNIKVNNIFK